MRLEINRPDWVIERLGNFAISEKGKKPKNQSKVKTELFKYPYVDIQAFEKNIFESYTDGEKCNFCNEADFLMVWDGSRSGLVGKAVAGAIGSTLVKIRFTIIENHFAYYFLKSKYLEINTKAKGTGTPHVNPDLLWNYSFPIPPLLEQKAIVAKVEQLFSELDNGIANLKAAQAKLKIYRQAVLKKAFDECGGSIKIIDEVVANISEKIMPSDYGHLDFIGMDCINEDSIKPSFLYKFSEFKSAGKLFKTDQLLYGRLRPYLNKVYLAEFDGVASGEFIIMQIDKKQISPKFLMWLIHSKKFVNWANKQVSGDRPRIKFDQMKQFEFTLPTSLQEQNQIVQEIESRLSVCDKIEETIEAALSKSEALRQSILKKAFEGRLLSEAELENIRNHPNYESAHELLARIKQEKSQASQTPPQKQTIKPVVSTDIHAGLIAKIIKAHQDNDYMEKLSHVKCEKIAHLVEYHVGVALGREPVKDAAGPNDYPHLKKVEHRAIKTGYFTRDPKPIGYSYLAGRNIDKAIRRFEESIDVPQNNKVNDLINLFLKFDLQSSEIVATLYAAWNNLLLAGKSPNDEEIVYEARENWSSQKLNIDRDRFFKALQWMRQKDISLVPHGAGLMVAKH